MNPDEQTNTPLAPVAPTPPPQPVEQPAAPAPAPVTAPVATPPAPAPAPAAADPNAGHKILLVEDDNALADVYTARLEAEGFNVKRVPNGEEALATAMEFRPSLIVLDVMMPKVSGFDVLDILRNTPETANVKVIMLTALSQDNDQQRAEQLGADDYLVKSQVVIADVVERIKHHLNI